MEVPHLTSDGRGANGDECRATRDACRTTARHPSRVLRRLPFALLVLALSAGGAAEAKVLRVGTSGDYVPFSFRKDGSYEGLDAEIARRMARDLGYERVEFVRFRWPELAEKVRSGAFDVAISGVTTTPERALIGRYTRPYAATGAMLLIRTEDAERFAAVSDLDRPEVRIAVNKGGYLERLAWKTFRRASIQPVTDNQKLPRQVLLGTVDAALTDSAEILGWMRWEFRAIGPFTRDHKAMLLPADRETLADRIDGWLMDREKDGWLEERRARFLGENGRFGGDGASGAACDFVRLRLGLMPMVGAAKRARGLPVEDAEQEKRVVERARAWSTAGKPDRALAVIEQLMDVARAIQLVAVPAPQVPLEDLRGAIERIDRQLVREVERSAPGRVTDWKQCLAPLMDLQAIREDHVVRLAVALALPENLPAIELRRAERTPRANSPPRETP